MIERTCENCGGRDCCKVILEPGKKGCRFWKQELVKYGRWEAVKYISYCSCGKKMDVIRYKCSECNKTSEFQAYGLRFCPYCGSDNGDALRALEVQEDAGKID